MNRYTSNLVYSLLELLSAPLNLLKAIFGMNPDVALGVGWLIHAQKAKIASEIAARDGQRSERANMADDMARRAKELDLGGKDL